MDYTLTPRSRQIVELLLQGRGNAEIAEELKIKVRTVKAHLNRMFFRFQICGGIKRVRLAMLLSAPLARAATGTES